ncbi:MAG: T9SS type A sorting domain-containing protein [Bacteroidota bacterium]
MKALGFPNHKGDERAISFCLNRILLLVFFGFISWAQAFGQVTVSIEDVVLFSHNNPPNSQLSPLSIYPNPATDRIWIKVPPTLEIQELEILTQEGELVFQTLVLSPMSYQIPLNADMYLFRLKVQQTSSPQSKDQWIEHWVIIQ